MFFYSSLQYCCIPFILSRTHCHFAQVAVLLIDRLTDLIECKKLCLSILFRHSKSSQGCFGANDKSLMSRECSGNRVTGVTGFAGWLCVNRSPRASWMITALSSTPAAAALTSLWRIPWRCCLHWRNYDYHVARKTITLYKPVRERSCFARILIRQRSTLPLTELRTIYIPDRCTVHSRNYLAHPFQWLWLIFSDIFWVKNSTACGTNHCYTVVYWIKMQISSKSDDLKILIPKWS